MAGTTMDYPEYRRAFERAAAMHRDGDPVGAAELFESLVDVPWLAPMDRSILLFDAAACLAEVGPSGRVEALYDRAIAIERPFCRSSAREGKAAWLEAQGRHADAVELYSELAAEPWATVGQRRGFEEQVFRIRPS